MSRGCKFRLVNTRYPSKALIRRLTASVVCLCWLVSFVYCQTLCLMGADMNHFRDGSSTETSTTCHGATKTSLPPCHSNSESSDSEGGSLCCCSVDLISQNAHQADWIQAHDLLIPQCCLLLSIQPVSSIETMLDYLSSQSWRDWTLTPELCLGPAIHSQAPPSFS